MDSEGARLLKCKLAAFTLPVAPFLVLGFWQGRENFDPSLREPYDCSR